MIIQKKLIIIHYYYIYTKNEEKTFLKLQQNICWELRFFRDDITLRRSWYKIHLHPFSHHVRLLLEKINYWRWSFTFEDKITKITDDIQKDFNEKKTMKTKTKLVHLKLVSKLYAVIIIINYCYIKIWTNKMMKEKKKIKLNIFYSLSKYREDKKYILCNNL